MACDFWFASTIKNGENVLLRLYTWTRPTISLGYHQRTDDIDLLKCESEGVDVVQRPTGGRAILHSEELTYCIIYPVVEENSPSVLKTVYRKVHSAILKAAADCGVKVGMSDGVKPAERHHPLCFASSAGSELTIEGRKAVGSAQRLIGRTILQHGSILLGDKHLQLANYLNLDDNKRTKLAEGFKISSAALPIKDSPEFREMIAQHMAEEFTGRLEKRTINEKENKQISMNRKRFRILTPQEV